MNIRTTALSVLLITGAVSCAPIANRGVVAMKITDQEGHICLGKTEASAGDKISVYRNRCERVSPKVQRCQFVQIGEGVITEVLNEHYSVARFTPETHIQEGDVVERVVK